MPVSGLIIQEKLEFFYVHLHLGPYVTSSVGKARKHLVERAGCLQQFKNRSI
jgi:hypothetical protein